MTDTIIEDDTWDKDVSAPLRNPSHIGFLPKTQSVLIPKQSSKDNNNHLSRTALLLKLSDC